MIEDDAVVREADQLDLFEEQNEVLLSPDQERLLLPVPPHMFLQDPEQRDPPSQLAIIVVLGLYCTGYPDYRVSFPLGEQRTDPS